jgi:hypothetical protein
MGAYRLQAYARKVVNGSAAADALATCVGMLDSGSVTPTGLARFAADHELNAANIDLVGLLGSGIVFG